MSERQTDHTATTSERTGPNAGEQGKWVSGLVGLLGLWLVVAALLFTLVTTNFWNFVIVGVLLMAIGGYNYFRRSGEEFGSVAAAAFAALLGIWLVVSPWLVDTQFSGTEIVTEFGFWNAIVVGALVLILGGYSAYEARDTGVGTSAETR